MGVHPRWVTSPLDNIYMFLSCLKLFWKHQEAKRGNRAVLSVEKFSVFSVHPNPGARLMQLHV